MTGSAPRPFLTAEWRWLALLQYEIGARELLPLVPPGTELDPWCGRHLVSLVGFRFLDTRLRGLPIPCHRSFTEINLRFYVRRRAEEGWRRGVVFVREIVPRAAIAAVARSVYHEPYVARSMRSRVDMELALGGAAGRVSYEWRSKGWCEIAATTAGPPELPAADSEAAFLTEHYWGYTRQRDGGTAEYRVSHPAWRVWGTAGVELRGEVASEYGPRLGEILRGKPLSAFVAEGSAVEVFPGRRLSPAPRT